MNNIEILLHDLDDQGMYARIFYNKLGGLLR